jgi:hypothetical protein
MGSAHPRDRLGIGMKVDNVEAPTISTESVLEFTAESVV